MKTITRITDYITNLFLLVACIYLFYIVFACGMQVFSRYVLNKSFAWTEETARFAFASMGMLGVPVALRKGMHVSIDLLNNLLNEKWKNIQRIVILILVFIVSSILFIQGITLFNKMEGVLSPAVRIPMQFVYYSVPLCGLGSMWIAFVEIITIFNKFKLKEVQ